MDETPGFGRRLVDRFAAVDRRPELVRLARRLRRTLPGDPGFGDPLSTAGTSGPQAVARLAGRWRDVDEPSAVHELGFGVLQAWQALLERTGAGRGDREVTVVFTDLVGFSTWSLAAGDVATLDLLRRVAWALEPAFTDRGGTIVKRLGDGLMVVFDRPERALEAIFAARAALTEVTVDSYRPRIRVGAHTGLPRRIGSDWLGVDVTVAARMMELAGNGHVVVSSATLDALPPGAVDALGLEVRPHRRGLFTSAPKGVPPELGIWRVRTAVATGG
ncbi:adenylate/guanylate cyclase domain-containing protein [Rhodococcus ruber]|uniref:adenylate/guanylate cyclase domain-containing protein n=1 Tax=Rhodococcus TaxID=1827 RepID=UPI00029B2017|nr:MULTISPECIES: adenylate/guanylate cyclase domain-containing protein [Rhodococcus]ATQ28952.1 adenylate/guanylate cyclase domain-containing protein [Rhodococcus ruber]